MPGPARALGAPARPRVTAGPPAPDPDPDGVILALAVALGVVAGARLGGAAWAVPALGALAAGLGAWLALRPPCRPVLRGLLALAALAVTGAAVAGARAASVQGGLLVRLAGHGGLAAVEAAVAEEPRRLQHGAKLVTLTVRRVALAGGSWRVRERAVTVLPRGSGPIAAGDRLWLRAGLVPAKQADRLGRHPPVELRRPLLERREPSRSPLLRASERLRAAARAQAGASLPPPRAGLLLGMGLGDTSLLPRQVEGEFTASGLTHLMAVSGANLAVVLACGLGLALLAGAGRGALAALGVTLVALFAVLTRWQPSVLRAGAMAALVLAGVALRREPGGRRALALAVALLLLADPSLASALGFQLSVAATAGILWAGPLVAALLPGWLPAWLRAPAAVSLGAQAGAAPLLALALGRLSLPGLLANALAAPIAAPPMVLGLLAALLAPVAPWPARLACRLAEPFLAALLALAHHAAALPLAAPALDGPARALPAAAALALLAAGRARRRRPARGRRARRRPP